MQKIGFIGLGIMGKPMARNLMKAGYSLVVYDTRQEAIDELSGTGAEKASSPSEVAMKCKTIILMLPNGPEVKEVVSGTDGIINTITEGTIIIDMSSVAPSVSREMYAICKNRKARFMDAPVSGGEPKAIEGSLAVMVGCDKEDYEPNVPILKCMGASVVRTGNIGSGNVTKLVNQIIVAINIAALSEGLVLGARAGVDPSLIFEAIKGGLAGSAVMNAKTPMILSRNFKPGFKTDLHIKDLTNALDTSNELSVPMPMTSMVMEIMKSLKNEGKGQNDHSVVVQYFEKKAGIEVINNQI